MTYSFEQFRRKCYPCIYEVYEIFQNYFSPERTDLQGLPTDEELSETLEMSGVLSPGQTEIPEEKLEECMNAVNRASKADIIIHWPVVNITNETGHSVRIYDLYAKVVINCEGKIPYWNHGFELNRATFQKIQYLSGYVHSHVPRLYNRDLPKWEDPCLGSGPIGRTIATLKGRPEEEFWMLFCKELDLYVTVESLTGGPYIKMEDIGNKDTLLDYSGYSEDTAYRNHISVSVRDKCVTIINGLLIQYLKKGHIKFAFKEGKFQPGMDYFDYMIDLANTFIGWFNEWGTKEEMETLFSEKILVECVAVNRKFCKVGTRPTIDLRLEGTVLFKFKGQEVKLHILPDYENQQQQRTIILNNRVAMYILHTILRILNYRFKNENNSGQQSRQRSDNVGETASTTYQTVLYL